MLLVVIMSCRCLYHEERAAVGVSHARCRVHECVRGVDHVGYCAGLINRRTEEVRKWLEVLSHTAPPRRDLLEDEKPIQFTRYDGLVLDDVRWLETIEPCKKPDEHAAGCECGTL